MNEPNKEYLKMIRHKMPASKHVSTMIKAFVVGGFICMVGQSINDIYTVLLPEMPALTIRSYTTMTVIFITAVLTGFGIYDKIGAFAGAGSIVPITGFANSVVSSAEEHKREGIVLGLCTRMFEVAGPVIVFGVTASVVVGFVYFIIGLF